MRPLITLLVLTASLLSACSKKLEEAELNTNPFDADYGGPALVVKLSDTTWYDNQLARYRFMVRFQVRKDLFPQETLYSVQTTRLNDGVVGTAVVFFASDGIFGQTWESPTLGSEYCTDVRVGVDGSYGRAYRLCGIAGN